MDKFRAFFSRREFMQRLAAFTGAWAWCGWPTRALGADRAAKSLAATDSLSNPFTVGGTSYATLQAAFDAVPDGGAVIVKGGSLFNDQAAVLSRNNVTITTDTGTARFRKKIVNDKGCFQIKGNNTAVSNIEFEGMHSTSSANGAGIRLEGKGLQLSNCKFIGCDDGILTNNATAPYVGGPGSVTMDHCLFDSCGAGDGQSHGIYIGYGLDSILTLTNSTFQYTYVGHLVKTRSYKTIVDNCLFIKGTASRAIDACNGGHVSVKNSLFYQDRDMKNPQFIGMGGT